MSLPERIWVCRGCEAIFVERWRLKRHLMMTHDLIEEKAWDITDRSEYWLRIPRSKNTNRFELEFVKEIEAHE